jgi:hypothetical protein
MSQGDWFFVFAGIVLSNDLNWMPTCLFLLHECTHVVWHSTFVNKECASLEVASLFGCNMPHCLATKFLVLIAFLHSCNVVVHLSIELVCFFSLLLLLRFFCFAFAIAQGSQVLSAPLVSCIFRAAAVCCVISLLE